MRSDVRIQHLLNKPDDEVIIMSDKVKKINEYDWGQNRQIAVT
jgi:hypothetical protein